MADDVEVEVLSSEPRSSAPGRRAGSPLLRGVAAAALASLVLGCVVVLVGLLVPPQIDRQLQDGIWDTIIWRPYSPPLTDARFRSNNGPGAPPDLLRTWLFNVTNLDEVRAGGLPKLEQVGPYVHHAVREKHEVLWDSSGRVQFKDYSFYRLDERLTGADPNAPITTLNLALLGVLANLHGSVSPPYRPFVDVLMQAIASYQGEAGMQGLFTTKPAMELLWGYEDRLLQLLNVLLPPGTLPDGPWVRLLRNTSSLEEALSRPPSVVNTGIFDSRRIWDEEADRGRTLVSSWPCPERVHGSDASQFPPGLNESARLTVFIADLYQSRDLVVHGSAELHGVKLLRFKLDPAQDAPNACRNMELQGLMNITTPQAAGFDGSPDTPGPPVFVSAPMFCGADPRLAADAGLRCDPAAHMTWVDVEPTTGITMRAAKRLMMSSRVADLGAALDPAVRPNLTLPMFWAEEAAEATPELAAQFKARVYRAQWLARRLGPLCFIAGGVLLLLGVLLAVLAVELAEDPDKWPGAAGQAGVLATARRMLDDGGSRGRASSGSEGPDVAAQQPLLPPAREAG